MTSRGSHTLVQALMRQECDTVFGIPGVGTLSVYDSFCDFPDLRHIETRHEQGAVFMADGYARASGRPGVAINSGGPGALNTLTAMATAYNDSVPILHIVSENPPGLRGQARGYFHDIRDQFAMFRPVTGFAVQVELASEIPMAVRAATHALLNRRARPALVEISSDALESWSEAELLPQVRREPRHPDPDTLRRAASILAGAQRPVIWAGAGVASANGTDALVSLAERLGAPVLTSQKGQGVVSADHPLHVGNWARESPGQELLDDADALLVIGNRLSYFPTAAWTVRLPRPVVHVDIDPAVPGRNYPVDVSVIADARVALEALNAQIELAADADRQRWMQRIEQTKRDIARTLAGVTEVAVLDEIRRVLPRDAMVFNDPTTIAFWGRSAWQSYCPRSWFIPAGFGTLGYAIPAAIGGAVGGGGRVSVAIIGDAGAMFTIQELMTAVQERIPVVLLVFNDQGYGVERAHQDRLYGRRSGVDVAAPDFVALAESFGAFGEFVDDPLKVGFALERALEHAGPALIEVNASSFVHPGYATPGAS
jgi:5-guanidino-2-oxopentanoate decarboxylase